MATGSNFMRINRQFESIFQAKLEEAIDLQEAMLKAMCEDDNKFSELSKKCIKLYGLSFFESDYLSDVIKGFEYKIYCDKHDYEIERLKWHR